MSLLHRLLRGPPAPIAVVQLRSATDILARFHESGGEATAALRLTRDQVAGLQREVEDDERWPRLVEMARRIGDPWNADDWPLGFDPLVCCVPLCARVDYACATCPVGQRQGNMSCAHPSSLFGQIGDLVRRGDRDALLRYLRETDAILVSL